MLIHFILLGCSAVPQWSTCLSWTCIALARKSQQLSHPFSAAVVTCQNGGNNTKCIGKGEFFKDNVTEFHLFLLALMYFLLMLQVILWRMAIFHVNDPHLVIEAIMCCLYFSMTWHHLNESKWVYWIMFFFDNLLL